ncbi:MAG TPA: hypothetical protein PLS28_01840, partial [Clostridiales bacterium]|nr:hypothetical protein [Clostridiales bacterium]
MQTTKKVFKSVLCLVAILLLLAFLPIDRGVAFASFALQGNKETEQVKEEYQYYYQNLTGKEKEAYRYICAEIEQFPERVYIPELNKEELNRVFEAVLYDHPEYWFLDNHCNYESRGWSVFTWSAAFLPVYRCDSETYQKQKAQVEAAAEDILAKA